MIQKTKPDIKLFSPYSCAELIDKGKDTLTVLISGFGYSLEMPIFYYTQKLLESKETNILRIDFAYNKDENFLNLSDKRQDEQFIKEVSSLQNYLESTTYSKIIFIGKSLGTSTIFNLLNSSKILAKTVAIVWITPASVSKNLNQFISSNNMKHLIIYGINDKYSRELDSKCLSKNKNVKIYEVSTNSHRLEHIDLKDSLKTLNNIISNIKIFIDNIIANQN